jgi:hypothetical protein
MTRREDVPDYTEIICRVGWVSHGGGGREVTPAGWSDSVTCLGFVTEGIPCENAAARVQDPLLSLILTVLFSHSGPSVTTDFMPDPCLSGRTWLPVTSTFRLLMM